MSDAQVVEERHGFPGALRAWGVWGAMSGPPTSTDATRACLRPPTIHAGLADPVKGSHADADDEEGRPTDRPRARLPCRHRRGPRDAAPRARMPGRGGRQDLLRLGERRQAGAEPRP